MIVKLTDFDSAKQLDENEHATMTAGVRVFTYHYLDPNLRKKVEKREKAKIEDYLAHDVFGAAAVAYEVIGSGDHLYKGEDNFTTQVNMYYNKRDNLLNASIDELGKNLIWTMTQSDPTDRVDMEEAKASPYFNDLNDHILFLNAVNEAIIDMSNTAEGKKLIDDLNADFFMVFQVKWQEQDWPFIIAEVLKASKYNDALVSFLRYCRNLVAHSGQYQAILEKRFGFFPSGAKLLGMVLEKAPCMVVHFHWFAKRHLSHLSFTANFPENCAKAYDEQRKFMLAKIGEYEELRDNVCPSLSDKAGATARLAESDKSFETNHAAIFDSFLQNGYKEIQKIIQRTEVDFKALKQDVKTWERRKENLERTIEGMRKSGQSPAEIDQREEELAAIKEKLKAKWFLQYRDQVCEMEKFRVGEYSVGLL